jgi:electron transport complex protein RnfC
MPGGVVARSALAGVVTGEREAVLTNGAVVRAVVVQVGTFQADPAPRVVSRPFTEQLRELLTPGSGVGSGAGGGGEISQLLSNTVWGARHGSPDFYAQLRDSEGVDTVIVTALDSDPAMIVCGRVLEESAADVLAGALLVMRQSGATKLLVVMSVSSPERVRREVSRLVAEAGRVAEEVRGSSKGGEKVTLRAVTFENHYPSGDPSLLILRLLGKNRVLQPGMLPTSRGVFLLDSLSAAAIGRAIRQDAPLMQLPLAVKDHVSGRVYQTRAPVGTPVEHVVGAVLGNEMSAGHAGGGVGGIEIRYADVLQERVVPGGAVLSPVDAYLHVLRSAAPASPDPCIRCGWCVEACPTRVHPASVLEASQTRDVRMARGANVHACIECGLCQYVCPSRLPLLTALRSFTAQGEGGGR